MKNGKSAGNGLLQAGPGHTPYPTSSIPNETKEEILADYRVCHQSRLASLLGRREVLTGKAKFGIFGDGKEVPQVAMARAFRAGDWRSGYYRDQTFMFATGTYSIQEFFAQLYAHTSVEAEPASAGRMMNGHFGTRSLNPDGSWKNLMAQKNSSADISPTSGQMPRLVGLAYASKLYRETPELQQGFEKFSEHGNEVAFGTIGNASTSEGLFWEAFNAAGVLQIPMAISIWDDGYGISVPAKYQTCKEDISEILRGFEMQPPPTPRLEKAGETLENPLLFKEGAGGGYLIYKVNGWDYPALLAAYREGTERARNEHTPVLFHIAELTQPQGHSTSGSHERYKSKERLEWETEHDCVTRFRKWIIESKIANADEMDAFEAEDKQIVDRAKQAAWDAYLAPIKQDIATVSELFEQIAQESPNRDEIIAIKNALNAIKEPIHKDIYIAVGKVLRSNVEQASRYNVEQASRLARVSSNPVGLLYNPLLEWKKNADARHYDEYASHLYSESEESALKVPEIKAEYTGSESKVDGRQVMQACFDAALARDPRVFAIGEDIGVIGDVNKGFEDLQAKYGELRVTDTGIREATILGQGIGAAMRGLRPIIEIQYLDYLLFALETLSDDLATVQWRTKGGQKAPVIVRTRGHRLEGVWHSGSPMGMILNALRGMYVLVPRNMTQAAGFYNTILRSDDTALIVEVLNGYRLKETIPANVAEFTVPLGIPEILHEGTDITLVTYGACCRVAMEAAAELERFGISLEVIDVQTLIPFDRHSIILESLKKTSRIIFLDEDVPGGASAYMLRQVLEVQDGYHWLDAKPVTITGKEHRPAYGSDGDYFSKPQVDDVIEAAFALVRE
ncbi:MAG TPA: thiamine pyrophosphate-dependent enzyme [Candidatus Kapabacteria bacterium]|nr:thiamine pyrophosphate-dependent enzyme [Candidatus Kapabacteria bacterium]